VLTVARAVVTAPTALLAFAAVVIDEAFIPLRRPPAPLDMLKLLEPKAVELAVKVLVLAPEDPVVAAPTPATVPIPAIIASNTASLVSSAVAATAVTVCVNDLSPTVRLKTSPTATAFAIVNVETCAAGVACPWPEPEVVVATVATAV
jgi:hypothetical protein